MRIAQDSPNLQTLKVGNCYKLTDVCILCFFIYLVSFIEILLLGLYY